MPKLRNSSSDIYSIPVLKNIKFPKNIIFFDTEYFSKFKNKNNITQQKLDITCFIHVTYDKFGSKQSEKTNYFYSVDDIHKYLYHKLKLYKNIILMAHNSDGDIFVTELLQFFTKHKMKNKTWYVRGLAKILVFKNNSFKITILDSMNYFQTSVDKLGTMNGTKKIKFNFKNHNSTQLKKYVYSDTKIIETSISNLISWLSNNDLGSFGFTISSISLSIYRHKFMSKKISINKKRRSIDDENKSYHGGKTENYFVGKVKNKNLVYVDFNSMYPYIMKKFKLPTNYKCSIKNPTKSELKYYMKKYCCIADVDLDTIHNAYAKKINNKVIFPIGRFNSVLSHAELEFALKYDDIKKIKVLHLFISSFIFYDFIDFFYTQRMKAKQENNEIMKYFYKIIMNSLYGKFAQKISKYEKINGDIDIEYGSYFKREPKTNLMRKHYVINHEHFRIVEGETSKFNFTAISSIITGYGRIMIYELCLLIGKENVYYMDTDSIILDQSKLKKIKHLINDNEIGKLKIESKISNAEFRTLKDYTIDGKEVIKGISKSAKKINSKRYKVTNFKRISQIFIHSEKMYMEIFSSHKILTHKYEKGIIQKNGRVLPFTFTEF